MPNDIRHHLLRPWLIVPLVAVVGVGAWLGARSGGASSSTPATAASRTVEVTSGPLKQNVSASGTITPADTEDLSFSSAGTVTAVKVAAGDKVVAGQVLATIDSASLQSQVTQAASTLATAQAKLSSDTTAGASAAQLNLDQANVTSAQASLASAQTALAGATLTASIDGTVSTVNLTVGEQLGSSGTSGTNLTGTGTGSGRTAGSGSSSGSGSSAGGPSGGSTGSSSSSSSSSSAQISIITTDAFHVTVNVDDTQIAKLAVGQVATVTPGGTSSGTGGFGGFGGGGFGGGGFPGGGAFPGAGGFPGGGGFGGGGLVTSNGSSGNGANGSTTTTVPSTTEATTGIVTSVSKVATTTSGVASFPVVVTVTGTHTGFYDGASATVAITYNTIENAVQVPVAAVQTTSDGSTVTVVNADGSHTTQAVTTGVVSNGEVQVTSGLSAGQQVLVTIPTFARAGSGSGTGGTGGTGTRTRTFTGGNGGFQGPGQ